MVERIMRIIRLDKTVFTEIANDPAATQQAAIVVVAVALLSGIGSAISGGTFLGFISGVLTAVIGWLVWSFVAQIVSKALFQGKATFEQLLRALGYAEAPMALGFFVFIPCIGWLPALAGGILMIIAGVKALMQVQDFDIGKAIVVIIIGAIAFVVVGFVFMLIFGLPLALAS